LISRGGKGGRPGVRRLEARFGHSTTWPFSTGKICRAGARRFPRFARLLGSSPSDQETVDRLPVIWFAGAPPLPGPARSRKRFLAIFPLKTTVGRIGPWRFAGEGGASPGGGKGTIFALAGHFPPNKKGAAFFQPKPIRPHQRHTGSFSMRHEIFQRQISGARREDRGGVPFDARIRGARARSEGFATHHGPGRGRRGLPRRDVPAKKTSMQLRRAGVFFRRSKPRSP